MQSEDEKPGGIDRERERERERTEKERKRERERREKRERENEMIVKFFLFFHVSLNYSGNWSS